MDGTEDKYIITDVSERQMAVLMRALDCYARLGTLQIDKVIDDAFGWDADGTLQNTFLENRDEITRLAMQIRNALAKGTTSLREVSQKEPFKVWSLGISNAETLGKSKVAYEMLSDIKRKLKGEAPSRISLTDEESIKVEIQNRRKQKIKKILDD